MLDTVASASGSGAQQQPSTYQLAPLEEPLVALVLVEDMTAGKDSHNLPCMEVIHADGALVLGIVSLAAATLLSSVCRLGLAWSSWWSCWRCCCVIGNNSNWRRGVWHLQCCAGRSVAFIGGRSLPHCGKWRSRGRLGGLEVRISCPSVLWLRVLVRFVRVILFPHNVRCPDPFWQG